MNIFTKKNQIQRLLQGCEFYNFASINKKDGQTFKTYHTFGCLYHFGQSIRSLVSTIQGRKNSIHPSAKRTDHRGHLRIQHEMHGY